MGVIRSRARPGAQRSVRALAWWNLALSRTTAEVPGVSWTVVEKKTSSRSEVETAHVGAGTR